MKQWEIINKSKGKGQKSKIEELITLLLENRGIMTEKEREDFLHPKLIDVTLKTVGIDFSHVTKTIGRIKKAIANKERIIVYGDYDVDGITGTAILWETLYALGADVIPYIPNRFDEGYGLSVKGISNFKSQISKIDLIITVDNGIVANEAVAFANEKQIDVIITDHHAIGEEKPAAYTIVHTTKLCGAGVAYLLSKELKRVIASNSEVISEARSSRLRQLADPRNDNNQRDSHLELAALGTVADLVPLIGANRTIVKHGLEKLARTKRPGLRALFEQAGIANEALEAYHIGFIIGPRLNAAGRIEDAIDSLRLLCTTNEKRAGELAEKLELINKERQLIMRESAEHAILKVKSQKSKVKNIVIVSQEEYNEGVIGLIAGKLVEAFYRPAIVIAKREKYSKASVRSVSGFNIIEFLRSHQEFFVNVGGHPMAAGFTVETEKITLLQNALELSAQTGVTEEMLLRKLRIDCELPFSAITTRLYQSLQQLAPFGMGNAEPVFATRGVRIDALRAIGKEQNHLKLTLTSDRSFDAIAFGMGNLANELSIGDLIDVAYTIDENTWNGKTTMQLKIKDIVSS